MLENASKTEDAATASKEMAVERCRWLLKTMVKKEPFACQVCSDGLAFLFTNDI